MPAMPALPTRKFSKLWSSSATRSPAPSSNEETPTEERGVEGQAGWESPSLLQHVRLPFQERDKGGGSLANDIELRRLTNERLYSAAEAYWSSLSKKKPLPFEMSASSALEIAMTLDEAKEACSSTYTASSPLVLQAAESVSKRAPSDKEKLLPIESLGLAMASCSNTYSRTQRETGEDAIQLKRNERYASHLAHLSAVHLALGQLQADYTASLSSTLLNRLARSQAAIEALKTTEKAAEAAKEKMEGAEKRRDKAREKGEKGKREAEEEARMARATFEEAVADLETRAEILRETEQRGPGSGVAILREYMDTHLAWTEAQHDLLSKARAALDQWPSVHDSPQPNRSAPLINRAAPLPPSSMPSLPRRVVEPPMPSSSENTSHSRSTSSPKIHRPNLPSRASLSGSSQKAVASAKEEKERGERPPSRSVGNSDRPSSRGGVGGRIPFVRSESYSAPVDAPAAESAGKADSISKRTRLGSLGASLTRSSSSLGVTTPDVSKAASSTMGSEYTTSSDKSSSSWASNLLNRKKDGKKDAQYSVMTDEEHDSLSVDRHSRGLSHVKETSAESRGPIDDDVLLTNGFSLHTPVSSAAHDDVLVQTTLATVHQDSLSLLKPWEQFDTRRDSMGIGLHLTGNTASSSEGGNPFGHDGPDLSPTPTGNAYSPLRKDRMGSIGDPWGHADGEEDDPADGLLSSKDTGTVRKPAKR